MVTKSGDETRSDTTRGIVLIVAAMMVFASHDAAIKHMAQTYPIVQIMWIRYMLFAVFALAIARRKQPIRESFRSKKTAMQIGRALMLVLDTGFFVLAVKLLPLADAHALIAAFPLIVTALAGFVLGEQVGLRRWTAVLVGFVGVLVILRPGLTALQPGAFAALGAAFFFAVYHVMTRNLARYDSSETSLLYVAFVGLAVTSVIGPFFWVAPTGDAWLFLLGIGVAGTLGHFLLIRALEAAPVSTLQPFNYVLLVWATVVGFAVFGQLPDFWTFVGTGLIVASGLYTIYRERQRQSA